MPLTIELMGMLALIAPFHKFNSSSRLGMLAHHLSQDIAVRNPQKARTITGLEDQIPVFDIRMPEDGVIVKIIKKYTKTFGTSVFDNNPMITIIFRSNDTGQYDVIEITQFNNSHNNYSTKYVLMPIVNSLRPGIAVHGGTLFARNPTQDEEGYFCTGVSCNVANLSLPASMEDGYIVSVSFTYNAGLRRAESYTGSYGKKTYPLNAYGTRDRFQAFPNNGEVIRPDGLVMAFRSYDPIYDGLLMSEDSLMVIDPENDICIYGLPGALVHDVTVESGIGESKSKTMTSPAMAEQPEMYIDKIHNYYDGLLAWYEDLCSKDKNLNISHALTQLLTRAYADRPNTKYHKNSTTGIVRRVYNSIPLDEYRVKIDVSKICDLGEGAKMTGLHGDKGVICEIKPDHEMPRDAAGNYADVVRFGKSPISRTDPGQLYEPYVNAAARDLTFWVRENYKQIPTERVWERVHDYYHAVTRKFGSLVDRAFPTWEDKVEHLEVIVREGIYNVISPDDPDLRWEMFGRIEDVISPTYGPVTYIVDGKEYTTKDKCFIGVQQFIVLEKTYMRPMAISCGVIQHHGLLAGPNKLTRNSRPSKVQATTIASETEGRLYPAIMGAEVVSTMFTIANSPAAMKCVTHDLLDTDTPTNIPKIKGIVPGSHRALRFVNSVLTGFGIAITNKDKNE